MQPKPITPVTLPSSRPCGAASEPTWWVSGELGPSRPHDLNRPVGVGMLLRVVEGGLQRVPGRLEAVETLAGGQGEPLHDVVACLANVRAEWEQYVR